jgi:hypothetical protein
MKQNKKNIRVWGIGLRLRVEGCARGSASAEAGNLLESKRPSAAFHARLESGEPYMPESKRGSSNVNFALKTVVFKRRDRLLRRF